MNSPDGWQETKSSPLASYFGSDTEFARYSAEPEFRSSEKELFEKYFIKNEAFLDIGCGAGRTTFLIHQDYSPMVGVDICERLLEFATFKAKAQGLDINFMFGDATDLPFPDSTFSNALFSFNGIEGLTLAEDRQTVLKEIHRCLRSGGIFICSTHSIFSLVYIGYHIKNILNTITRWLPFVNQLYPEFADLKLGDIFISSDGQQIHWHLTNPFAFVRHLKKTGFSVLVACKSERLLSGKKPNLFSLIGSQNVFYVAQKK